MTGKNVYTMTAMTRRAFVGLAVMAAQAGLAGCVRNGAPDAGSSDGGAGKSGDAGTSSPVRAAAVRPRRPWTASRSTA